MEDATSKTEDRMQFLGSVLGEDYAALEEVGERIGGGEGVILLSCALAILVREALGPSINLKKISAYAKKVASDIESGPRRIALESVLRTGAGYNRILSGLAEDEQIATAGVLVRYISTDVERSIPRQVLIERALQLAAAQDFLHSED
jgi:hypothetical protein